MTLIPPFQSEPLKATNDPYLDFDIGGFNALGPLFVDSNGGNPPAHDTVPVDILGANPFMAEKSTAILKNSNGLRIGAHPEWFDANGELPPAIHSVFQDFASKGVKFLWMYASHTNANPIEGTNDKKIERLRAVMLNRCLATFEGVRRYLMKYPDMWNATVGMELFNEPAIFQNLGNQPEIQADPVYGQPHFLPHLYGDFCLEVFNQIKGWWPGQVHVGGYGYSARFRDLLVRNPNGESVIDRIRRGIGGRRLVWTWHSYPAWYAGADTYEEILGNYRNNLAPILSDRIFASEINVSGGTVGDVSTFDFHIQNYMQTWRWLRERDIGTGYFPPYNTGSSQLISFSSEEVTDIRHPHALAETTLIWAGRGDLEPGTTLIECNFMADWGDLGGLERLTVYSTLGAITICEQIGEVVNGVSGRVNMMYGSLGNDTISGAPGVRNFLYGVTGDNIINAQGTADWVRGGDGSDTITSSADVVFIDGGVGPSVIQVETGEAHLLLGGGGSSVTLLSTAVGPHTVYNLGENDSIHLAGWTAPTFTQNGSDVDVVKFNRSLKVKNSTVEFVTERISY